MSMVINSRLGRGAGRGAAFCAAAAHSNMAKDAQAKKHRITMLKGYLERIGCWERMRKLFALYPSPLIAPSSPSPAGPALEARTGYPEQRACAIIRRTYYARDPIKWEKAKAKNDPDLVTAMITAGRTRYAHRIYRDNRNSAQVGQQVA